MTDASRIEDRYWTCVDGEYVWWFGPQAGRGRACHINGDEDRSNVQEGEFQAGQDDDMPLTNTEARAILGDKWPANWPQGEGAVESTTAPATGNAVAGVHSNASSPDLEERTADASGVFDAFKPVDKLPVSIRCCTCGIDGMANTLKLATQDATIRELREGLRLANAETVRLRATLNRIAWPASFGGSASNDTIDFYRHIAQDTLAIGSNVCNDRATAAIARAREEGV